MKRRHRARNVGLWFQRVIGEFALNNFIWRRGSLRGLTHWLIMWGCLIAAAITFPLVFGWLSFESLPGRIDTYRIVAFGFPTLTFPSQSVVGFAILHGLVVSHFLSGTQTRRIGPLVDHCPNPYIEVHPLLAKRLELAEGDWATAETRRGSCTLPVKIVKTIRSDTIFIPYHWPDRQSANQLTIAAQDPISKIPEYKVCAVRLKKAPEPEASATGASPTR